MNEIKNTKLNNGWEEIAMIKMTSAEKKRIYENITSSVLPKQSIRSPWAMYVFVLGIRKNRWASYIIALFLIIALSGTGIVSASEESLPGDTLYPIKVSVIEPIHAALTFSSKAKAEYESNLATRRLVEAQALARENKLDQSKEKKLNDLLDRHTLSLDKALEKIDKTTSADEVDDIVTNFEAGMNAHAGVLDLINSSKDMPEYSGKNKISKNARSKGSKVRNTFKKEKRADSKDTTEDRARSYIKKKDAIQSIINSTSIDLDHTQNSEYKVQQAVIDNAHKTLDQARRYLDEADKEDQSEDLSEAYKTLLDSESSAKEAAIYLKTEMKLKEKDLKKHKRQSKILERD